MTSQSECALQSGSWNGGSLCSQSNDYIVIRSVLTMLVVTDRPCCTVSLDSSCSLLTNLECSYRGGVWCVSMSKHSLPSAFRSCPPRLTDRHTTGQLCSLTMCLGDLCQLDRVKPSRVFVVPFCFLLIVCFLFNLLQSLCKLIVRATTPS
jgi:hypothetical protein